MLTLVRACEARQMMFRVSGFMSHALHGYFPFPLAAVLEVTVKKMSPCLAVKRRKARNEHQPRAG